MSVAEKSSDLTLKSSDLTLSKEEMVRQEAIQTLEELGKKQNQASLLLLKLYQHLLTWSVITLISLFILFYLSPLLKDSDFCRDKSSNNSALIGIIAASISVMGFIKAANEGMLIHKLTCNLRQSEKNYNNLLNSVYTDKNEKTSESSTLFSSKDTSSNY